MGDAAAAINYFEESVEFLTQFPSDDLEYYDGDLQAARSYYSRYSDVRCDVIENNPGVASQKAILFVSNALCQNQSASASATESIYYARLWDWKATNEVHRRFNGA
ncbi:hypothetical protein PTKIN_Ptkin07bG0038300 [Pterospermum kingtungense]